ncbi:flagellar hook-associated protein FlgK [Pelagibacterium sediminicola]|uniref:flagellar hook-associated protein FlgK n=1 Tax=Pelagibacterium sediminicola TaxID=2248761 RepID=UPI000E30D6AB|nr:flagellar hook-associated protein FlgK [Pelagibacterium sediminicola]
MGLSSTLSNALGGMNASQRGIDVLSRNVANQGTPGYHRQSLTITETAYGTSAQVRTAELTRAFNEALEKQHLVAVSNSGLHSARASFLDRLQMHIGKPGDANSLDTLYSSFENAMQALATNPNDVTTRAGVLNHAQHLVEQLNLLSGTVQEMRSETEYQISNAVNDLNRNLNALADINIRILDLSQDETARLSLMDERDRLVAMIAENVDVKVSYRADGTVALMTETGVGILDVAPSQFSFTSGGALSATSLFSTDPAQSGVGAIKLRTPSGLEIDLGAQNLLTSGKIAGLMELRDNTLVNMQDQLDEIAAGLALALNTVTTEGTEVPAANPGDPAGFEVDLSGIRPGNSMLLQYTDTTGTQTVRLVHSEDGSVLPSPNARGERVIGVDLTDTAAVAAALGPDVTVTDQGGGVLRIMDDGGTSSTIASMTAYTTAGGNQGGAAALNLFVDSHGVPFSNSLDGTDQKLGFAGRIKVNPALIDDPALLVQYDAGISLGDPTRPQALLDGLKSMQFISEKMTSLADGGVRLSGKVNEMIAQMINHQGNVVARAESQASAVNFTLETLTQRMHAEYGVNVDEEMARLMQLQNAYSASARVVSVVQELIDSLMRM